MESKSIERCGYCGRYFIGNEYIDDEGVMYLQDNEEVDGIPLGYCPEANYEHQQLNPE